MNSTITAALASERTADLRRAAEHRRTARVAPPPASDERIVALRLARREDDRDVNRLTELDDARALVAPVLLAVVDGEAVAALSLSDGRVAANPFVPTDAAVALLRLRGRQLSGERRRRWRPQILRPRFA
ncbi:MAG TPA: hypothetical protein VMU39_11020 [Solirubrobacteraceae bacterium]|nr:hypothetical protein [Solirubrobacteraceae bacterium]